MTNEKQTPEKDQEKDEGATDTKDKEPIHILKVVEIDPETGQKVHKEKPVYSVDELVNLAQKGVSADSKWQTMPTLIRQEAEKIAEMQLEPRVKDEVAKRLEALETKASEVNFDSFGEDVSPATVKTLKTIWGEVQKIKDIVIADQVERKSTADAYAAYNKNIGEAIKKYGLDAETFVPLVKEILTVGKDSPEKVMTLATWVSKLSEEKHIDIDKLKPEDKEKLEEKFKAKLKAPSPAPEGGKVTEKKEERKTPMTQDDMIDAFEEVFKKHSKE